MTLAGKIFGVNYIDYDFDGRHKRRGGKWLNKEICKRNLLDVKGVLEANNVPYWLMYGTLLGAVRDNDFIEYDSDTDLGLFHESIESFDIVIKELMEMGFTLIRTARCDEIVSIIRDDEYMDFDFYHHQNMPFKRLVPYSFLGSQFTIPENPESFLTLLYGNWKQRIRNQHSVNYFGMHG
jgi:phosphorylcholine metabolism protein LicD